MSMHNVRQGATINYALHFTLIICIDFLTVAILWFTPQNMIIFGPNLLQLLNGLKVPKRVTHLFFFSNSIWALDGPPPNVICQATSI